MAGWKEKTYERLPVSLQHTAISLQGLSFRFRRSSDRLIADQLEYLQESEQWSSYQHEAHQMAKLSHLLQHAITTVPYYATTYRRLGLTPDSIQSTSDLQQLPILEKSAVRGNEQAFLSEMIPKRSLYKGATSGTTGTPMVWYESRATFSHRFAFIARLRRWAGIKNCMYTRRAQFTGRDIIPERSLSSGVFWRYNLAGNALLFSTTNISSANAAAYVKQLNHYQPELIDGYPSALLILGRLSEELGLRLPIAKAIISTAETLTEEALRELERMYGAPVFNQYSSSESSCFWCTCEYGTMHINPDFGITEIIKDNGEPAREGEVGQVVTTSLLNPIMPLIRYRLGDLAVPGPATKCECGRDMPRIADIVGRTDDLVFIPDRGFIGRLDPVFKGLRGIIESQIIQIALDHIVVLIVPTSSFSPDDENRLIANLLSKLGASVTVEVRLVDYIQRGANGKFKSVVSLVTHSEPTLPIEAWPTRHT